METYWCQYATDWTEIKARWVFTMTEPEAEAVVGMCETPERVVTESGEEVPRCRRRGSTRDRCTNPARKRSPRERSAYWAVGAEAKGSRKRWSSPRETGTETV